MTALPTDSRSFPIVALVLGAAVWEGGEPSPTLRRRAEHAARLFAEGKVSHVVGCGGIGRFHPSEATVIARICREAGVPEDVILSEGCSTRTQENILYALPMLARIGTRRVAIVTDRYHQPRARLIARRLGLICVDVPAVPPGPMTVRRLRLWLREGAAYLWCLVNPPKPDRFMGRDGE